jgi:hypothetical protein
MLWPSTARRCTGVEGCAVMDDVEHLTRNSERLTHAARRARGRPAHVARALARVQAREALSDEALAARLGIATVDLPRLALCRRPCPDQWDADLVHIPPDSAWVPSSWWRSCPRSRRRPHAGTIPPVEPEGAPIRDRQGRSRNGPIGTLLVQAEDSPMSAFTCLACREDGILCWAPARCTAGAWRGRRAERAEACG